MTPVRVAMLALLAAGCVPLKPAAPDPSVPPPPSFEDDRRAYYEAVDGLGAGYFLEGRAFGAPAAARERLAAAARRLGDRVRALPDDPDSVAYSSRALQLLGRDEEARALCARMLGAVGFARPGTLAEVMITTTYADGRARAGQFEAARDLLARAADQASALSEPREALYTELRYLALLVDRAAADSAWIDRAVAQSAVVAERRPANPYARWFAAKAHALRASGDEEDSEAREAARAHLLVARGPLAAMGEGARVAEVESLLEPQAPPVVAASRPAEPPAPAPPPAPVAAAPAPIVRAAPPASDARDPAPSLDAAEAAIAAIASRLAEIDDMERALENQALAPASTVRPAPRAPAAFSTEDAGRIVEVAAVGANLRDGPSTGSGAVVGFAAQGQRFEVRGRAGEWLRVGGVRGPDAWIHGSLVREVAPPAPRPEATEAAAKPAPAVSPPEIRPQAPEVAAKPAPAVAPPAPRPEATEAAANPPPAPPRKGVPSMPPPARADAVPPASEPAPDGALRDAALAARRGYRIDVLDAEIKRDRGLAPGGPHLLAVGAYVHNESDEARLDRLTVRCELMGAGRATERRWTQIATKGIGPGETAFVVFYLSTARTEVDTVRVLVDEETPAEKLAELGAPPVAELALQKTDRDVGKPVVYLAGEGTRVALAERPAPGVETVGWGRAGGRVRLTGRATDPAGGAIYFRVQTFTGDEGWLPADKVRLAR